MTEQHAHADRVAWYRTYVVTWVWLLVLTILEVSAVYLRLPRGTLIALLLIMALMKATLIGAYFMHLRYERLNLIFVIVTPMILVLIMFLSIARDALNVFSLR